MVSRCCKGLIVKPDAGGTYRADINLTKLWAIGYGSAMSPSRRISIDGMRRFNCTMKKNKVSISKTTMGRNTLDENYKGQHAPDR